MNNKKPNKKRKASPRQTKPSVDISERRLFEKELNEEQYRKALHLKKRLTEKRLSNNQLFKLLYIKKKLIEQYIDIKKQRTEMEKQLKDEKRPTERGWIEYQLSREQRKENERIEALLDSLLSSEAAIEEHLKDEKLIDILLNDETLIEALSSDKSLIERVLSYIPLNENLIYKVEGFRGEDRE